MSAWTGDRESRASSACAARLWIRDLPITLGDIFECLASRTSDDEILHDGSCTVQQDAAEAEVLLTPLAERQKQSTSITPSSWARSRSATRVPGRVDARRWRETTSCHSGLWSDPTFEQPGTGFESDGRNRPTGGTDRRFEQLGLE